MCGENCTKAELYPTNLFDVDDAYDNLDSQSLTIKSSNFRIICLL